MFSTSARKVGDPPDYGRSHEFRFASSRLYEPLRSTGALLAFFPTITTEMLVPFQALLAQLATDPKVLDQADCPYSNETKDFLKRLAGFATSTGGNTAIAFTTEELEQEVSDLLRSAKEASANLGTIEAKDKMAVLKGQGQLLEKLIELRERMLNLKHMSAFKRVVIDVLDTVCTPAQRTEITTKLGDLA